MNTLKKSVSVILAALVLCGCVITAFASDGFSWTEADGEITITGYSGTEKNLAIPGEIDGKPVTAIKNKAFEELDITSAVIPAGVRTIGDKAFLNCALLSDVTFAEGSELETIGLSAFQSCSSLKSFVIPEGTKTVGQTVFSGTKLEELTIPASVTAFYDTTVVTEIGSLTNPDSEHIIIFYEGTAAQWSALVQNSAAYADLSVFRNLLWSVDSQPYVNIYMRPGITITKPANPAKDYYNFMGWAKQGSQTIVNSFGKMPDADVRYNAVFEAVEYTATFLNEQGGVVKSIKFTVETPALDEPAVPAKEGYTGSWEPYELKPENITIHAKYTINSYTITFIYDNKEKTQTLEYGSPVTAPEVEDRVGYDFVWTPAVPKTMPAKDLTCTGEYVQQVYQAKLFADGRQVGSIPYVYGQKSITLPEVPEKEGHTGEWLPYSLPVGGTEIYAEYTANTYTATFVVDGKKTVYNVKFGSPVKAPTVTPEQGYKLVWSPAVPATMPAKNITINGSFVCVSRVKILKNTGKNSIDYGCDLQLYADTADLPSDAKLVWSITGGKGGEGSEFNTGTLKSGATVTLKLVGADNKAIKDADGNEIKDTEEIAVNGGIFKIIIWFFKNLFKANMTVYQK